MQRAGRLNFPLTGHGWAKDRNDHHARDEALRIAREEPLAGLSPLQRSGPCIFREPAPPPEASPLGVGAASGGGAGLQIPGRLAASGLSGSDVLETTMRKLLTSLIALGAIVFAIVAPVWAQGFNGGSDRGDQARALGAGSSSQPGRAALFNFRVSGGRGRNLHRSPRGNLIRAGFVRFVGSLDPTGEFVRPRQSV